MLPNVKLHRLPNGMRVIVVRTPGRKRAYFELEMGSGYADEPLDKRQSAHLIEHLIARRWHDALLADEPVHYVGGLRNATTSLYHTSYYASCHPRHLKPVIGHFVKALDLSAASEPVFLEERARVVDEFLRRNATPRAIYDYRWLELHLGHDRHRAPLTAKEKADFAGRLQLSDLRAFQSEFYVADRAILTVVGDFKERRF